MILISDLWRKTLAVNLDALLSERKTFCHSHAQKQLGPFCEYVSNAIGMSVGWLS